MAEFLPIIIVGAIIGTFTVIFLTAYILEKKNKNTKEYERHMSDKEITARLLAYAKPYWKQFVAVLVIMLVSIVYDLVSPLLVGHIEETVKGKFALSYLFSVVAI